MFNSNGNIEVVNGIKSNDSIGNNYTELLNITLDDLSVKHGYVTDSALFKIHQHCIVSFDLIEY